MMCTQIPGTQVGPQNKGISAVLQGLVFVSGAG